MAVVVALESKAISPVPAISSRIEVVRSTPELVQVEVITVVMNHTVTIVKEEEIITEALVDIDLLPMK